LIDKNIFPKELRELRQWLNWRSERDEKSHRSVKVPYNPITGYKASTTNPETWGTLEQALESKEKYLFTGIGFVFTSESGIIGIDIDNCIINEKLNDVATAILEKLPPTYIEISPSGKGLHIFLMGKLPSGGNKNSKTGVEMYGTSRYFTMTGNRWHTCVDEIAVDNGVLNWIHSTYIKPPSTPKSKKSSKKSVIQGYSTLTDEKLLEMA
jgi:primase-polymerase (primpol)-like protein